MEPTLVAGNRPRSRPRVAPLGRWADQATDQGVGHPVTVEPGVDRDGETVEALAAA